VDPEKCIQYFEWFFSRFKSFPALVIEQGNQYADIGDLLKRQAQKQAVINIKFVGYGLVILYFSGGFFHGWFHPFVKRGGAYFSSTEKVFVVN
jgi:hypothetical protein